MADPYLDVAVPEPEALPDEAPDISPTSPLGVASQPRPVPPAYGYGSSRQRYAIIAGVVTIIIVAILSTILFVYLNAQIQTTPASDASPTPSPVVVPSLAPLPEDSPPEEPLVVETPSTLETLSDYFSGNYQVTYQIVYNPEGSPLAPATTSYTITKYDNQVLLDVPAYQVSVLLDFSTNQSYFLDHAAQTATLDPETSLSAYFNTYFIPAPQNLVTVSLGEQEWNGIIYQTESYPGLTAFFSADQLVYLRHDDTGIIGQISSYSNQIPAAAAAIPSSYTGAPADTPTTTTIRTGF